ncbi:hypothetical protein FXB41_41015 [Bradyrhizobium canariense]|uniref:hypothetical protein n=1 Tax=Bradyrhizobium canariense TaxID=255045 RepID=UPI001CA5616B|nr:hypothetical protein [Bradyrhizobium canariense]MBW5440890.1 hypothetical protein [Bradyrhizobium canariense]
MAATNPVVNLQSGARTLVSKKTVDTRLRVRALRQRIKENPRRDPIRFHHLPLHDSVVAAILDDVEIEQAHEVHEKQAYELTDKERDRRTDSILAAVLEFVVKDDTGIVRRAVKNKRQAVKQPGSRK